MSSLRQTTRKKAMKKPPKEFDPVKFKYLGKGAFSRVYRYDNYTVKIFVPGNDPKSEHSVYLEEKNMLARIVDIPHVPHLQYTGRLIMDGKKRSAIFFDYIEGYSLTNYILCCKETGWRIPEDDVIIFSRTLLKILVDLSEKNIVHQDIKPDNILFNKEDLNLIDFGLACVVRGKEKSVRCMPSHLQGTRQYMSPEKILLYQKKYPKVYQAADVWALGVTLFYLVNLYQPFSGRTRVELSDNILQNKREPFIYESEFMKTLIEKMLTHNYLERPTAEDLYGQYFV